MNKHSEVLAKLFWKHKLLHSKFANADIKANGLMPGFQKKWKTSKDNCRPISILPDLFKIHEWQLNSQI